MAARRQTVYLPQVLRRLKASGHGTVTGFDSVLINARLNPAALHGYHWKLTFLFDVM
jgi:hypothetical protein